MNELWLRFCVRVLILVPGWIGWRRFWFRRVQEAHKRRSGAVVLEMERDRGLR